MRLYHWYIRAFLRRPNLHILAYNTIFWAALFAGIFLRTL